MPAPNRPGRHLARVALATIALAGCKPASPTAPEILWDTWGVPHIYAGDDAGVFKAFGYAQMASHANLILKLYAEGRGRAAEYLGAGYADNDRYVRTMGIPARAQQWYDQQRPAFKADLDAFADGMNLYANRHPDQIADSVKAVLPITPVDVVAHAHRVIHFTFVSGNERAIAAFRRPASRGAGSNTWAISPRRSASGHALLLANPHLGWSDLFLFYEAHWNGPGYSTYGAALVGFPVPVIAFNDSLGWSHTVNTYDGSDSYRLTKSGDGYRWDGAVKLFETATETIKIKQPNGTTTDDTVRIRRSIHGPVVADSANSAIAVRVAGLDHPGMLEQWWDMARAKSLDEFQDIMRRLDIPMFNAMYADHAGHIYYLFGGDVPVRPRGDWRYWFGTIPGDSTATLWNQYLTYDQLPKLIDPSTGWLQNANDPPWTSTVPTLLKPDSFPPYLAPVNMAFRPQRSAHMLFADSSITFDELIAYKNSTRMELADRLLDELIGIARKSGSPTSKRAADVLEKWDRQAQPESRGAVLFTSWVQGWFSGAKKWVFKNEWRIDSAITTPAGIADPGAALRALDAAAEQIEKKYGSLDVPYGDVMRVRYGGKDLPGNGAPGDPFGVFRTAYYVPDKDGKFAIAGGDTYYALTEFGSPVRAKVLLAYGNATQSGSKHVGDQLELFAKQQMRDAWLARKDVEAHLEGRDEIGH